MFSSQSRIQFLSSTLWFGFWVWNSDFNFCAHYSFKEPNSTLKWSCSWCRETEKHIRAYTTIVSGSRPLCLSSAFTSRTDGHMATVPPLTIQPDCYSVVKATVTKAKQFVKPLSIRVLNIPPHVIHSQSQLYCNQQQKQYQIINSFIFWELPKVKITKVDIINRRCLFGLKHRQLFDTGLVDIYKARPRAFLICSDPLQPSASASSEAPARGF